MRQIIAYQAESLREGSVKLSRCDRGVIEECTTSNWQEAVSWLSQLVSPNNEDFTICFNLQDFTKVLFALLPLEEKEKIEGQADRIFYEGCKVFYVNGRYLGLTVDNPVSETSNIIQRWEINLQALKWWIADDDDEPANIKEVWELGTKIVKVLDDLKFYPTKLTSPVAVFADSYLGDARNYPTIFSFPEDKFEAMEYATEMMRYEWRSAYQIGVFDTTHLYDLNCYSADTDVLTTGGWTPVTDLVVGDSVYAFNKDASEVRVERVEHVNKQWYDGDMVRISNSRKVDLLVTPNHRVLYRDRIRQIFYRDKGIYGHLTDWRVCTANRIPNGNIAIPVGAPMHDKPDYPIRDELLELIAWINTEGWERKDSARLLISQSRTANPENCTSIIRTLTTLGANFTVGSRERNKSCELEFRLPASYAKKYISPYLDDDDIHLIPMWILLNCSLRQLRLFYETLLRGDGSERSETSHCFYSKLRENADRFSWLCVLLGHKTNSRTRVQNSKPRYYVEASENAGGKHRCKGLAMIQSGAVHTEGYHGWVACPTVKSGFIVVRRNGRISICGNSAYPSVIARLPSTDGCRCEYATKRPPWSTWGICYGDIQVDADVSPLVFDTGDNMRINPKGHWEGYFTTREIEWLERWQAGTFKLIDGWFFLFSHKRPYQRAMDWLYYYKTHPDKFLATITKKMSQGISGKLDEDRQDGKKGDLYNPILAAMVRSETRIAVGNFIYKHSLNEDLIAVLVDSVLTTKQVTIPPSLNMGDWQYEGSLPAIALSKGKIWRLGKKPQGIGYDQLISALNNKPQSGYYEFTTASGSHRSIDLLLDEGDVDRHFEEYPECGGDVLSKVYRSQAIAI